MCICVCTCVPVTSGLCAALSVAHSASLIRRCNPVRRLLALTAPPSPQHHKGERLVFHPKKIKTWEQFLAACAIVKGFTGAIRKVVTPDGHRLTSADELQGPCAV